MSKPTDSPAAPVPPLPDVDPYRGAPLPVPFTIPSAPPPADVLPKAAPKPAFDASGRRA
jgi:hypothetical protein